MLWSPTIAITFVAKWQLAGSEGLYPLDVLDAVVLSRKEWIIFRPFRLF